MLAQETRPLSSPYPEWAKKIPQPKFKIGQEVILTWTCDDDIDKELFGKTFRDWGYVVGCCYAEQMCHGNGFNLKWVYTIYFHYLDRLEDWQEDVPYDSFMRIGEADENELAVAVYN